MELKDALKLLRRELSCTQSELADALGVSALSVIRWENGRTFPRAKAMAALLELARCKGVSGRCRSGLQGALKKNRKKALKVPNSPLFPVERESVCSLVDASVNAIYVSDLETDELLYVNHTAEACIGKTFEADCKQKCYRFLFDRNTPCPQCPKAQMTKNEVVGYHTVSLKTGRRYQVKGRRIVWNGKPAHAQYFFEKTEPEMPQPSLAQIVNRMNIGVCSFWVCDDGSVRMNYLSDGYYAILQSTRPARKRFEGGGALNAVCDEDRAAVLQAVHAFAQKRQSFCLSYRVVLDNEQLLRLRMQANFVRRENGHCVYDCAVMPVDEDGTKETLFTSHRENLHSLIDEVPTGIGIYEVDHGEIRQSYMNNAFYAMMGQKREERSGYNGANTLKAAHPEDTDTIRAAVQTLLAGEDHTEITYRLHAVQDQWRWVHLSASVVERHEAYLKIYAAISDYTEIMRARHELESSRNMLRVALDSAKAFSWRYDHKTARITDSGTLGEAFHLPKTVDGLPRAIVDMGFVSPESEEDFYRLYRDTAAEKPATADIQSAVNDGQGLRWFRQVYTPVYDENGAYIEAVGIAIDITEQKRREQEYEDQLQLNKISAKDALSRVCLNLTRDTVTSFDSTFPEYDQNARHATASALMDSVKDMVHAESERKKFEPIATPQKMIELYRTGTTHFEIVYRTDTSATWQRLTYDMMENPYTGDMEAISAIYDVTEIERTKLVMEQLLAVDYASIVLIDLKNERLIPLKTDSADENIRELMQLQALTEAGVTRLRQFLRQYAAPGTAEKTIRDNSAAVVSQRLRESPHYECTYSLVRGGVRRHYRVVYLRVKGDSAVLLCAMQDITELYEHEEQQKKELAEALAQAQAASRAKTSFLSRVSHDMRTPLNGILGLTALMKDVAVSPRIRQDLTQLELSGQYLLNLINDTLDVSRIESGKMELHPTVCDSRSVLNNVMRLVRPSLDAKGITLTVDVGDVPMYPIYIDEGRLQQIAMNILGNAAKFTPEGGHVSVTARNLSVENGIVTDEFVVCDNGIGIAEEFLPHIFESFSQEDTARTTLQNGTGLGMAITYQIIKLMGGSVEVTSKKGEGTRVRAVLQFPVATEAQVAEWKKSREAHAASYNLAGRRVLLCEDHPLNAQIATRLLGKVDVRVERAENGAAGVSMFEKAAPGYYDAILMDIRMPVMDGLDAARRIRALGRPDAAAIPILAMTANALDEDMRKTREAGMDAHLSKPINPERLYRTLESCISPSKAYAKPRILVVDDIEVNRAVIVAALQDDYEILEADSGEKALQLMHERHGMDAVITDIQMPGMDGVELIRRLRQDEAYRHTVIIANTQYEQPGQEEFLLSLGANDFIYKPANPQIVKIRIENALHGR